MATVAYAGKRLKLRTQRDRTARADTSPCAFSDRSFSKGRYGFALVHALSPMSARRLLAGQVVNIDSMEGEFAMATVPQAMRGSGLTHRRCRFWAGAGAFCVSHLWSELR